MSWVRVEQKRRTKKILHSRKTWGKLGNKSLLTAVDRSRGVQPQEIEELPQEEPWMALKGDIIQRREEMSSTWLAKRKETTASRVWHSTFWISFPTWQTICCSALPFEGTRRPQHDARLLIRFHLPKSCCWHPPDPRSLLWEIVVVYQGKTKEGKVRRGGTSERGVSGTSKGKRKEGGEGCLRE
jgi:hypothetical protein